MICPKCSFDQPDSSAECARCGIVFEKYRADKPSGGRYYRRLPKTECADGDSGGSVIRELLFGVNPGAGAASLIGRSLFFVLMVGWGQRFIFSSVESNYAGNSFMHLVNLPFHEAGHVIFRIFGRFMTTLGGSLMQLLIPLICLLTFLLKSRDAFGASVSLWWFGENFIDLAPYINDARRLELILIGGVTGKEVEDFHDWEFILRETGCLKLDHLLAGAARGIGSFLMVCSIFWGGYLLFRHLRSLRSDRPDALE